MALSVEAYYFYYETLPPDGDPAPGSAKARRKRKSRHKKETINLDWWSARNLLKRYPFLDEGDGFFRDFIWEVDKTVFLELAEDQMNELKKRWASYENLGEIIRKRDLEIQSFLKHLNDGEEIKVRVFEWESGLE